MNYFSVHKATAGKGTKIEQHRMTEKSFLLIVPPKLWDEIQVCTGCKSWIRKIYEFKIWKEPMLLVKQTIEDSPNAQFWNDTLKVGVASSWGHGANLPYKTILTPRPPMLFPARECDALLIMPDPQNFCPRKVSDLSSDVSFVSLLAMVLLEYWKRIEEIFQNVIISAISSKWQNLQKNISSSLFQYAVSTETNDSSKERPDTQLFGSGKFRGIA